MLLLAHPGIALGAAAAAAGVLTKSPRPATWFDTLAGWLDIRWLLVGSLLPDIIDKPVGQVFFYRTFQNGRLYAHTLLFLIVISLAAYLVWRIQRRTWLQALAAGTFTHLILDSMWRTPSTLFWPLMGWGFPKEDLENYIGGLWHALTHYPHVYAPELAGLAVLVWLAAVVIGRGKTGAFLRRGKLS